MPSKTMATLRTMLAITLVFALSAPVLPSPAFADEGGSDISTAVALPASPASGTLDVVTDIHDVYTVAIPAGQRLELSLTGDAGTDFDLNLFAPDATTVEPPAMPIAFASTGVYPETLSYDSVAGGTYYIDVEAWGGGGAYTLTWEVVSPPPADPDDSLPGVALPASPVIETLSAVDDTDDVYSVDLTAGQTLNAQLTGDAETEFFLYVLAPDASSLESAPVASSGDGAYPEKLSYTAPADGTYFLDAYASFGSGGYQIDWAIVDGGGPGGGVDGNGDIPNAVAVTSPETTGTVHSQDDPHDVFAIHALPGQTLNLSLVGPGDADFDLRLFGPDSTDLANSTPIQATDQGVGAYPEQITHTASVPGTYYADVFAFEGSGEYTLTISKDLAASAVSLATPPTIVYGEPATLTGSLVRTADGAPLAGREVRVEVSSDGGANWIPYATAVTTGSGTYAATLVSTGGLLVRALFDGDADHLSAQSSALGVTPTDVMSALSFSAPLKCAYRATAPITGTLATVTGRPMAYKAVIIEAMPYGSASWKRVGVVGTAADGSFSAAVSPTRRTVYRVSFEGAGGYQPVTSATRTITPRAYLTRPSAASLIRAGQAFVSAGYLKPRHTAGASTVKIDCYRYESGVWKLKKRVWAKNSNFSSYTRYSKRLSLPSKGKWKLVASVTGDWKHAYTQTSPRYVTVR